MVIVEPRKHPALSMVLQNFTQTLPDWKLHIFHGVLNEEFVISICADLKIEAVFHSLNSFNLRLYDYNCLLTDPTFYEQFLPHEYVLIFQTDTLLFPQSPFKIEEFLGYDYIGALWNWYLISDPKGVGRGGNGGLSLRKTSTMIRVLSQHRYDPKNDVPEDLFLSALDLHFPPQDLARRFSVESCFFPQPFGIHKPWNYLNVKEYLQLLRYAPEVKPLFDLQ